MTTNTNTQIVYLRGKTSFCRVLGEPHLNYAKDGREWTMDLKLDDNAVKEVKGYGLGAKIKTKETYLDGTPYMSFRIKEFLPDGKPAYPCKVQDANGDDWDHTVEIGNDSVVDVKFAVRDYGRGKPKGVYLRAVRVLDLVEYKGKGSGEFPKLDESDEFYGTSSKAPDFNKDFGLDDEDIGL